MNVEYITTAVRVESTSIPTTHDCDLVEVLKVLQEVLAHALLIEPIILLSRTRYWY